MLWICIALFFVRVLGQIEVLLLAPDWLPPMAAWYSGLLPYPILLPAQIAGSRVSLGTDTIALDYSPKVAAGATTDLGNRPEFIRLGREESLGHR